MHRSGAVGLGDGEGLAGSLGPGLVLADGLVLDKGLRRLSVEAEVAAQLAAEAV
jgi:hypothetical protein